jgi:hypothetical protein
MTLKAQKKLADRLVSAIAILRDGRCVTCGIIRADLQPGHFFRRTRHSVKWDLRNIGCQCPGCNLKHNENPEPLRRYIVRKIGEAQLAELEVLANRTGHAPMNEIVIGLQSTLMCLSRFQKLSDGLQTRVLHGRFTNRELCQTL